MTVPSDLPRARLPKSQRLFLAALAAAGVVLLGWSLLRFWTAQRTSNDTGVDLAREVGEYLQKHNIAPLSAKLEQLLSDKSFIPETTDAHALLDRPAPDFELTDVDGKSIRLSDALKTGPVVLVFYFGYHCNHCVGQLFVLNKDAALFKELNATILAVSGDAADLTRSRYKKYGAFAFPVLSDPGNKVAQRYGVLKLGKTPLDDVLSHGTFVIDRDGIVRWAKLGEEPFMTDQTLLQIIARLEKRG